MNTQNLKTFSGYIISTNLTGGYRVFKEEFDRYYGIMSRASDDGSVSDEEVAAAVLDFPTEPDEEDDSIACITPVDNLFRAWTFNHVTVEQFGKIAAAAGLGLLSPKDSTATDAGTLVLDPYPEDPTFTVVVETNDGKQKIIRTPQHF